MLLCYVNCVNMTRFARAHGSKASNKKVAEDSTPWRLLKSVKGHDNAKDDASSDSCSEDGPYHLDKSRVGFMLSDGSNSWSVVDQPPPSNSSKKKMTVQIPEKLNVSRMYSEFTGRHSSSQDKRIMKNVKKELKDEGLDSKNIRDKLKTKAKELAKNGAKMCYKCRKGSHFYKDCPEKDGSDICFTCGSTEHSFRECKKKISGSKFAFATCFICKEQGHLSSACPDNPVGLYPFGGGCHTCGQVTHFDRDCPQKQKKTAKRQLTVDTLSFDDIEGLPEDRDISKPRGPTKKPKVVKF